MDTTFNPETDHLNDATLSYIAQLNTGDIFSNISVISFYDGLDFDFSKPASKSDLRKMRGMLKSRGEKLQSFGVSELYTYLNTEADKTSTCVCFNFDDKTNALTVVVRRPNPESSLATRLEPLLGMKLRSDEPAHKKSATALDNLLAVHAVLVNLSAVLAQMKEAPLDDYAQWETFHVANRHYLQYCGGQDSSRESYKNSAKDDRLNNAFATVRTYTDALLLHSITRGETDARILGFYDEDITNELLANLRNTIGSYGAPTSPDKLIHSLTETFQYHASVPYDECRAYENHFRLNFLGEEPDETAVAESTQSATDAAQQTYTLLAKLACEAAERLMPATYSKAAPMRKAAQRPLRDYRAGLM